MGDRLTDGDAEQTKSLTYDNIFDELFPHYLMIGMTPEQYWDGESSLKPAYRKAYQLRMENEQRMADINHWYMGQYIMAAIQATPLIVPGVNMKKGATQPDYPDKPFLIQQEAKKNEAVRKKKEEDQSKLALAMFQAFTTRINKNIEKRLDKAKTGETGQ